MPPSLRALLAEPDWTREHVYVLADWFESQGDATADGVRHAIAWARRMGVDAHGLWAQARIGRAAYLMRWIPAGTGVLGSPPGLPRRGRDEPIRHRVRLTSGFWMGATPVTEGQYAGVMPDSPLPGHGANAPIVGIDQAEIEVFLRRENASRQHPLRLPTHDEWEFAARAGTAYSTGLAPGQSLTQTAWFGDPNRQVPHPVARKAPNPWGLYDMLGNVYALTVDQSAPQNQLIRGACWVTPQADIHIARRAAVRGTMRGLTIGFRLTLGAPTHFGQI